ncbi:MAG: hypothetical protein ACREIB_03050 [Pseudomonadota bacterium]
MKGQVKLDLSEIDAAAAEAERSARTGGRKAISHRDAISWLREVGVKKRRITPPWK